MLGILPDHSKIINTPPKTTWKMRWDIHCALYLLGITTTGFAFGIEPSSEFTRFNEATIMMHFGFEATFSVYFLFPKETAFYLDILGKIIFFSQAIIFLTPLLDSVTVAVMVSSQFLVADAFSLAACFWCYTREKVHPAIQYLALAVSLHWIGIAFETVNVITTYYVTPLPRQRGGGWFMIGFLALPQALMMRGFIEKKYNDLEVRDFGHGKWFALLFTVLLSCAFLVARAFRTIPPPTSSVDHFAVGIWSDIIALLGAPLSGFVMFLVVFWMVRVSPQPNFSGDGILVQHSVEMEPAE